MTPLGFIELRLQRSGSECGSVTTQFSLSPCENLWDDMMSWLTCLECVRVGVKGFTV